MRSRGRGSGASPPCSPGSETETFARPSEFSLTVGANPTGCTGVAPELCWRAGARLQRSCSDVHAGGRAGILPFLPSVPATGQILGFRSPQEAHPQIQAVECGAIEVLLASLRSHLGNTGVQERGCLALTTLVALPAAKPIAADAGALDVTVAALRAHRVRNRLYFSTNSSEKSIRNNR